ncbi:MAG: FG-GAP repeat protein [Acidobacteria bacterium]|nr:FG-GAP repeat protein [Acidobacteriota bacterium]
MKRRTSFFRHFVILALVALLLVSGNGNAVAVQNNPLVQLAMDTAVANDGLLTIYGAQRLGGEIGMPVGAGDINGDGRGDVIFCEMYASVGNRINNGQVNFYISDGRDTGTVDQAQNPANIFTLIGANSGDLLGTSVSANGDVNGDGIADVLIGAMTDDGPGNSRFNCGAAYLVYGAQNFNLRADLLTLDGNPPPGVIAIYGPQGGTPFQCNTPSQLGGRLGVWCDLGDVDGDGFADMVIGSDQINNANGQHVGGAFIIFGSANLPSVIDLASPGPNVRVAVIQGANQEDHWGAALQVGDINNDGIGDVIMGGSIFRDSGSYVTPTDQCGHNSFGASNGNTRNRCGEAYVIYGQRNWPVLTDLKTPPATATRIIGAQAGDLLGSQVHFGDLNGDGKTDLIIGALQASAPDNRGNTGAVYVIYGAPNVVGAQIDLAAADPTGIRITRIYGDRAGDCAGDSVRAYDINKDGLSDLFVGMPEHTFMISGQEREDAGATMVIFGQSDFLPPVIKFFAPPPSPKLYFLAGNQGPDGGDEFSYRLAGSDVDGDGFIDYVANSMHGDGLNDGFTNAGQVQVFSGKKLAQRLGLPTEPANPPTLTAATLALNGQTVQQANAGQSGLRVTINGTGFQPSTEILINGVTVLARVPTDAGLAATQRTVALDENPAIKNSAGNLAVRARNTNPTTNLSNEIVAGKLIGPEITAVRVKVKASGKTVLIINGSNFQSGSTLSVMANGQAVTLKSFSVESGELISAVIAPAVAPPSGTSLRIRVISPSMIQSNEFTAVKP